MEDAFVIPKGYVLVHESFYNRFLKSMEWDDIECPNMQDVSEYLGVSPTKIRKDIRKPSCPLVVEYNGGKGRGNITRFFKSSVESYKEWLKKY